MAATMLTAVVQVPPRGLWRASGQARWAPAGVAGPDDRARRSGWIMRRYLAAFGPATVADVAAWSGLTGVRAVVEGMRDELVVAAMRRAASSSTSRAHRSRPRHAGAGPLPGPV